jgi:hypothetical protein
VKGHFVGEGIKPGGLFAFEDVNVPFWRFSPRTIPVGPDALLCIECGMVWGKSNPEHAKQEVEQFGTDELKKLLEKERGDNG